MSGLGFLARIGLYVDSASVIRGEDKKVDEPEGIYTQQKVSRDFVNNSSVMRCSRVDPGSHTSRLFGQ